MAQSAQLLPVILCGGSGTRLWPLSRENYPKQFLALTGGQSMLQQTVGRLDGLAGRIERAPAPLLVCNEAHRFLVAGQLLESGVAGATILLEPVGRNTAPALTIAALQARADGADPVLIAMPADHVVRDAARLCEAVQQGFDAACEGHMVTFGIVPDRPETGYGYIHYRRGDGGQPVHAVQGFAEKPDAARARQYLADGNYLWNSGMFMLRASRWLDAIARYRPDVHAACTAAMAGARHDHDFIRPDAQAFAACPADSIDYAVMEKLPGDAASGMPASVVALQAGWSDLGAWDALWDTSERDARGNVLLGRQAQQLDCADSLLLANDRLVVGLGLRDVVVVETPDAVLVADKGRTQDVRQVVGLLKERGSGALVQSHRKVHRPWGWYDSIDAGERFQVKRIVVRPGASLSLQMHHHRAEHWIVVRGTAEVTRDEETFLLGENESTYIPLGHRHRLSNPGKVPLEIIEVQSGSYLGEDDIVRFDDVYGRAPL